MISTKCPKGHEEQYGRFCTVCGAKIVRPKLPKGPYKVLVHDPGCPGCGSDLRGRVEINYCPCCGHAIEWDWGDMR